ncbi:hypothetical protein ACHAQA_001474 [Verticillium albo-atrum]
MSPHGEAAPEVPEVQIESGSSDVPELPPPPNPSSDPSLLNGDHGDDSPRSPPFLQDDIFKMSPRAAMKLLGSGVEALARITGDIPPTPPPTSPTLPHMRGIQFEKDSIIRSNSEKNLFRMRQQAEAALKHPTAAHEETSHSSGSNTSTPQPIDGVHLRPNPTPSPQGQQQHEPYIIIGENSQPLNLQHGAITRKFYSKKPPPISIEDYLARLHRFCPMSTAVYLATSLYIHRLAVDERAIPVTRRNCHRLVLAGLRVAMKALEDLSYAHGKMAKVGGVSEVELARLEISFCFLANFELVVREDALQRHADVLREGTSFHVLRHGVPTLTLNRKPKDRTAVAEGKENEPK